ncbi:MAG: hypothetical protein ACOY90_11440 [Candidatus Zhuqueibacterota bacterium]
MNRFRAVVSGLIFCMTAIGFGGEFYHGTRGPLNVVPAWNIARGDVTISGSSRFYFNNKTYPGSTGPAAAVTFWDIQGGANIAYGIARNYQVGISQIIYQDNHKPGKGYNFPDDLFFDVRIGSFPNAPSMLQYGARVIARVPLAQYHNVPLEPYSAGKVELGLFGLLSYSANATRPDDALNGHVNLGIIDHNDKGANIAEEYGVNYVNEGHSRELFGGLALIFPTIKFDFSAELYGNYYISKPPQTAFSRHNYIYVTPGITYKASPWAAFTFGFDFRLTSNKSNDSYYLPGSSTHWLPTFPTWRVNFNVRLNLFSKEKTLFAEKEKSAMAKQDEKKDVYQEIATERKKVENAEAELEKIKEERRRMDEILVRLRKALENTEKQEGQKEKK